MARHAHLLLVGYLVSLSTVSAGAVPPNHHHSVANANVNTEDHRALPARWYHEDASHPVHRLFGRQENELKNDGETYPEIGSPEWAALFPPANPPASRMPQAWKDALKAAEDAGRIPDTPIATRGYRGTDGHGRYEQGIDPSSPEVCSSGRGCRQPDDIFNGLDGYFAVSFNNGPHPGGSAQLYDYLSTRTPHIPTTHFLIGQQVHRFPDLMDRLVNELHADLAVHSYDGLFGSLTSLSNEDIVAQLAWTMEIIRVSTGGKIPRFWRPPAGDADNRVRAIAKEVLGLEMVLWNKDTEDSSITRGGLYNLESASIRFNEWAEGPKSPGLIILEHELNNYTAQLFIDAVPVFEDAGWNFTSVAQMREGKVDPHGVYRNVDAEGNVSKGGVADPGNAGFPEREEEEEGGDEGGAVGALLSSRLLAFAVVIGAFLEL